MTFLCKLSDTTHPIPFLMVAAADHIAGLTGATPTVTLSKNGGAFAAATGTVAEVGSGQYKLTPSAADVGTFGGLTLSATAASADPTDKECQVVAFDPYDVGDLGLTNLDAAISTRASQASLDTVDDILDTEMPALTVVAAAIKAKTDALPSDPSDASDIVAAFATVNTKLDTIDDILDTEVPALTVVAAAIKVRTDLIPATPAAIGSAMTLDMTQTVTDVGGAANTLGGVLSLLRAMANGKLTIVSGLQKLFGQNGTTQVGIDRTVTGTVPTDTTRQ